MYPGANVSRGRHISGNIFWDPTTFKQRKSANKMYETNFSLLFRSTDPFRGSTSSIWTRAHSIKVYFSLPSQRSNFGETLANRLNVDLKSELRVCLSDPVRPEVISTAVQSQKNVNPKISIICPLS